MHYLQIYVLHNIILILSKVSLIIFILGINIVNFSVFFFSGILPDFDICDPNSQTNVLLISAVLFLIKQRCSADAAYCLIKIIFNSNLIGCCTYEKKDISP